MTREQMTEPSATAGPRSALRQSSELRGEIIIRRDTQRIDWRKRPDVPGYGATAEWPKERSPRTVPQAL